MRLILAIATLLALTACSDKKTTTVVTPDGKMEVTQSADGNVTTITGTGEQGQSTMTVGGTTWPTNAPPYATPYPGAKVVSTMTGQAQGEGGTMITFITTDPAEQVTGHYAALAKANGLTAVGTFNSAGGTMFSAERFGTGESFAVMTSLTDGQTTVQLIAGKGKR